MKTNDEVKGRPATGGTFNTIINTIITQYGSASFPPQVPDLTLFNAYYRLERKIQNQEFKTRASRARTSYRDLTRIFIRKYLMNRLCALLLKFTNLRRDLHFSTQVPHFT